MPDVVPEKDRRLKLWKTLSSENLEEIEPQRLRELGVYGGAQGIWVDKSRTASPEMGLDGVTVRILHTGRHYADDLSEDGVIYHYPKTSRPPARDAAEVQATKNAMVHRLPIFILRSGKTSQSRRSVKLGWVCDFDDNNGQFLVLFGQDTPPDYAKAQSETDPFALMEEPRKKTAMIMVRTGQQRFRFTCCRNLGVSAQCATSVIPCWLQQRTFAENLNEEVMIGGTEFHYVQPTIMLSIITYSGSHRVHVRFYVNLGSPRPI